MGNSQNAMSQYYTEEDISKTIDNNQAKHSLINSFQKYQINLKEAVSLASFSQMIANTTNQAFASALFKVFQSDKNKMYFNDYRSLYYTFKVNNPYLKICFIAEIVFGNTRTIQPNDYNGIVSLVFDRTPIGVLLRQATFINHIKGKEKDSNGQECEVMYSKEKFIGTLKYIYLDYWKNVFFKTIIRNASKPFVDDLEKITEGNYICTCSKERDNKDKNKQESYNEKLDNEYEKMKSSFSYKTNQGVYRYDTLKEAFIKVNIKPELEAIILNYLHLTTMKPYLDFPSFKSLMLQCTKSPTELCSFILAMIYYPNESGPKAQITKATGIKLDDIKEDTISIRDGEKFISHFADLIDNMDMINLIPFVDYGITPVTMSRMIKVLSFLMKNMKWEEFLMERIDKELSFYAINKPFWSTIENNSNTPNCNDDDNEGEDDLPKVIDNKSLSSNDFYIVQSKKAPKFSRDFVLLPKSIYSYLQKWFTIDTTICIEKISQVSEAKNKPLRSSLLVNNSSVIISKGDKTYELPIYPIHIDFYYLKKLYDQLKDKRWKYYNLQKILGKHYQPPEKNRKNTLLLSETMTFKNLKHQFQSSQISPIKLYIYDNDHLRLANDDDTFINARIQSFSLLIIDTLSQDNEYFFDKINSSTSAPSIPKILPGTSVSSNEISSSSSAKAIEADNDTDSLRKEGMIPPIGLRNMGNTCYFNAVLQIFLNLSPLDSILKNDKLAYFINEDNSFGYKGKLFRSYMNIISRRDKENSKEKITSALASFKKLIGDINEQFNNTEQQDANEFMTFMLESFHEEINIKGKREYCVNPPQLKENSDEEMSRLNFANTIRRGASFIDALFMFQLKSNLTCEECSTRKIVYETNYILDLPVMMDVMIEVEIVLHRLPFELKVYYDKINDDFGRYCQEHNEEGVYENLRKYSEGLVEEKEMAAEDYYKSKKNVNVPVTFSINIKKTEPASVIIERIRKIVDLELEPSIPYEPENEGEGDSELVKQETPLIKLKCKEMTSYVITRTNGTIVSMDSIVDDCFPSEQKKVIINEELNINGINKLIYFNNPHKIDLIKHVPKGKAIPPSKFDQYRINQMHNNDILCLSDYLSYYNKTWITNETFKTNLLHIEYIITIYHYHINHSPKNPFNSFHHNRLHINPQYIILNNSLIYYNGRSLYDIVWENNKRFLKSPTKPNELLWWRSAIKDPNIKKHSINKLCYPFILRNCIYDNQAFRCAKCPWYVFCPGCVINPYNDHNYNTELFSNSCIVVDWCGEVVHNELVRAYFNTVYSYNTTKLREEERLMNKEHTLDDCFRLFCEKEKLDDELHCEGCNKHQSFIKNYDLCKPPSVLIISLKRFKYNEHSRYKIRTFINYPMKDMVIKGEKYDLYGVVHHHGSIMGGHYTSTIKCGDTWMTFDDEKVYSINERQVLSSTAYLLVYCAQRDLKENDYFQSLLALFDCIDNTNKKRPKFSICKTFFRGEPVITSYGKGYVMETIEDETTEIIPIKFVFGKGDINKKEIKKETLLKYQMMNEKEMENAINKENANASYIERKKNDDEFIVLDKKEIIMTKIKISSERNDTNNDANDRCLII